jgi:hypothetical protein
MTSLSDVDFDSISERLIPARVRVFQIVQVSLVFGIMVLLAVILFLFGVGSEVHAETMDEGFARSLTITLAIVTLLAIPVAELVYKVLLGPNRLRKYASEPLRVKGRVVDDPAEKVLTLLQQATIARVSIYNVPACFGLIICLVGVHDGFIFAHPQYIITTLPAFLQLGFLAITFPTRDRLLRLVRGIVGSGR